MAARIPVVVSQSIRREPLAVEYEEQLVTELMFSNGLDATLIGPLLQISLDSTDHLCLEGLKGSFALLSWGTAEECREELRRLRIDGEVIAKGNAFSGGAYTIPQTSRWIDYFQLDLKVPISTWVDQLKELLRSREVKTYSILSINNISKQSKSVPEVNGSAIVPSLLGKTDNVSDVAQSTSHRTENLAGAASELAKSSSVQGPVALPLPDLTDDEAEWPHLEDLMDEFDQADV